MHCFDNTTLEAVSLHKIGNKIGEEGIRTSSRVLSLNDDVTTLLLNYFLMPLKKEIYFNFFDERSLTHHIVYNSVSKIFENPQCLLEESVALAKHLYEQGDNPKIKNGEFYTAYFENCEIDGENVDAIGLFKSEHKDYFLKIFSNNEDYEMQNDSGINIQKLDKGCLIFNTQKENGYVVCVHDVSKNSENGYWIDMFLQLRERSDDFYYTQHMMTVCKEFVTKQLPEEFEVNKIDQADLLNKSAQFFKENDSFDLDEYTETILPDQAAARSFKSFKKAFEHEHDMEISDQFDLSEQAVKQQSKIFKSIIKLDKNFHIYVHGDRSRIERAYDEESGLYYYKLLYQYEE